MNRRDGPRIALRIPPVLGGPDFARLWAGQTLSQAGSQVSLLAIPLIAISALHATPFEVGLLSAAEIVPYLLVGLPAGAWVDRVSRRRVLIAADVGRAAALATIPVAGWIGALSLAHLYLVAATVGLLSVFFDVAYLSYVPALVDREQIAEANATLEASSGAAQIAGPGVAGALIQAVGAASAVAVDTLSFAWSVALLLLIRTPEAPSRLGVPVPAEGTFHRLGLEIREGLDVVLRQPYLRSIAVAAALMNLFASMFSAVILLFIVRGVGLSAGTVGAVLMLGNLGVVAGALAAPRIASRLGVGPTLVASAFATGVGALLVPLAPRSLAEPWLVAAIFAIASTTMIFNITSMTLRQSITPPELQGRVHATSRLMSWATRPAGAILGGIAGSTLGIPATLWIGAVGYLLAIVPLAASPVLGLRDASAAA